MAVIHILQHFRAQQERLRDGGASRGIRLAMKKLIRGLSAYGNIIWKVYSQTRTTETHDPSIIA